MLSVKTVLALGVITATALASPFERQARVVDATITSADCDGRMYNSFDIFGAATHALKMLRAGKLVGQAFGDQYPRPWANPDNLTIATPAPWFEFPMLEGGAIYNGDEDGGPERVIFTKSSEVAAVVTVTQPEGVEEGAYKLCATS